MEWPASAKRGGASARIRRAIAPILSSRMWLATVTGPHRHRAGITGAYIRGELTRPGISKIGIELSMHGSGFGRIWRKSGNRQLKTAPLPVNYAANACESGPFRL